MSHIFAVESQEPETRRLLSAYSELTVEEWFPKVP